MLEKQMMVPTASPTRTPRTVKDWPSISGRVGLEEDEEESRGGDGGESEGLAGARRGVVLLLWLSSLAMVEVVIASTDVCDDESAVDMALRRGMMIDVVLKCREEDEKESVGVPVYQLHGRWS
jgi:hypothetical protein